MLPNDWKEENIIAQFRVGISILNRNSDPVTLNALRVDLLNVFKVLLFSLHDIKLAKHQLYF